MSESATWAHIRAAIERIKNAPYDPQPPVEIIHPREADRRRACHGSYRPCWAEHSVGDDDD